MIREFLKARGLELSEEKTHISHIIRKIGDRIKRAKAWKQEDLINVLNPLIIGWSNYHRSAVAKEIFGKLDHIVWNMLWRWAKRRHPDKRNTWVANRY